MSAPGAGEGDAGSAAFAAAQAVFEQVVGWLAGEAAAGLTHAELEAQLDAAGGELLCKLLQDHLDLRALREERIEGVVDADGVAHGAVEVDHARTLATIFGAVTHRRLAYRKKGHANLHPADAALNLPHEKHSHGLRGLAAVEACRDSFDGAVAAIARATGQQLGKRQVEALARRAAVDFAGCYADRDPPQADSKDVLATATTANAATITTATTTSTKAGQPSATSPSYACTCSPACTSNSRPSSSTPHSPPATTATPTNRSPSSSTTTSSPAPLPTVTKPARPKTPNPTAPTTTTAAAYRPPRSRAAGRSPPA